MRKWQKIPIGTNIPKVLWLVVIMSALVASGSTVAWGDWGGRVVLGARYFVGALPIVVVVGCMLLVVRRASNLRDKGRSTARQRKSRARGLEGDQPDSYWWLGGLGGSV